MIGVVGGEYMIFFVFVLRLLKVSLCLKVAYGGADQS